jgi:hypothetical protein
MTTWTNTTKNASTFTNQTKNSATFTNVIKSLAKLYILRENGFKLLRENGYGLLRECDSLPIWANTTKN